MSEAEHYERRGDYTRAVRSYHAALKSARCAPGLDNVAIPSELECVVRLGRVMRLAGRYRWAESLLTRAIELLSGCADRDDGLGLVAMNEIAVLYKSTARFDEAASLYD